MVFRFSIYITLITIKSYINFFLPFTTVSIFFLLISGLIVINVMGKKIDSGSWDFIFAFLDLLVSSYLTNIFY